MKIYKTTEECNKYNTENKSAIGCGLMEAWEPDDKILKEEADAKAREDAKFQKAKTKLDILKMLDPNTDGARCLGVRVEINEIRSAVTGFRWRITGYRLKFGDWSCKRWIAMGDGTTFGLNEKQKAKAIAILLELQAEEIAAKKQHDDCIRATFHKQTWLKVPENETLIKDITGRGYADRNMFALNEDSTCLTCFGETFTVSAWQKIVTFKKQQAVDLEAFKNTFKKNLTSV